jgi:hypothetical protein
MVQQFNCKICGEKDFPGIDEVNYHIRRNHRIPCLYCGLIFYRENNLKTHVKYVHEHVPWTPPQFGGGNRDVIHRDAQFDIIIKVGQEKPTRVKRNGV